MRTTLTTLAELVGLWFVVLGICSLVGGPLPEVASIAGGLALVVFGVSESA